MRAERPPSWWRFEILRPNGGYALWYLWHGHGRRVAIWSPHRKLIDVGNLREILREIRTYGWRNS